MDDYCENIVSLVRAYLKADASDLAMKKKASLITTSFKSLSLTTLAPSSPCQILPGYLREEIRSLNHYERLELQALLFYVSKLYDLEENDLCQHIEDDIGIDSLDEMTLSTFIKVRRYLHQRAQQGQQSRKG